MNGASVAAMIGKKSTRVCAGALLALALSTPAIAQVGKLAPADDAATDKSWLTFKSALISAVQKHDRRAILRVIDRNVRNGLGAKPGTAEFEKAWEIGAADSALWRELPKILFLGARYVGTARGVRELCAPYVAVDWPAKLDRFVHGAIISNEALVKTQPSSLSATIATLSYDIVVVLDWEVADAAADSPQHWVKVRVGAGDGYVPEEQIRSPVEHRACFSNASGRWKITAMVSGE